MKAKCPNCGKPVTADNNHHPFCSERCRLVDLGGWLTGNYTIMDKHQPETWHDAESHETRH